jgi:hypothetical protein
MSISPISRRYPRVELPKGMLVAWQHSGIRRVSRVSVLAVGGIFIATYEPPPIGDVITIFFEVAGGEVRARARICDSRPGKGMGIEFTSMAQESRARLTRLMKILNQETNRKHA